VAPFLTTAGRWIYLSSLKEDKTRFHLESQSVETRFASQRLHCKQTVNSVLYRSMCISCAAAYQVSLAGSAQGIRRASLVCRPDRAAGWSRGRTTPTADTTALAAPLHRRRRRPTPPFSTFPMMKILTVAGRRLSLWCDVPSSLWNCKHVQQAQHIAISLVLTAAAHDSQLVHQLQKTFTNLHALAVSPPSSLLFSRSPCYIFSYS